MSQEEVAENILSSELVKNYTVSNRHAVRKLLEAKVVSLTHDQPGIGITKIDDIMMRWEDSEQALISRDQVEDILSNEVNMETNDVPQMTK